MATNLPDLLHLFFCVSFLLATLPSVIPVGNLKCEFHAKFTKIGFALGFVVTKSMTKKSFKSPHHLGQNQAVRTNPKIGGGLTSEFIREMSAKIEQDHLNWCQLPVGQQKIPAEKYKQLANSLTDTVKHEENQ